MTKEEAIEILNNTAFFGRAQEDIDNAIDMAVEVLEQESILDKLRAEIEKQYKWLLSAEATTYNIDIAFDAIRKAAISLYDEYRPKLATHVSEFGDRLRELPPVQPRQDWIPLTKRPMTDEETEHYFEYTDMRIDDTYTILDCPLPDDGQEVLVSWGGNVGNDVFIQDNEGCYFEGIDIDEVDAWMPLPKPYKAESEEEK